ncbi:imidazole glycerol phosphate synthase subunit HisH [Sediminibacterium roseum]|uniref:Imidazole glycerol phosphate synthase subunit HisH n=1 Tax=Sediminibacterium roseum TaxID=1978412 RepID=A0ABW9ZPQ4_9BACT|nr:imidazole glycerol phosphate synthase subunit HisH [Sediminibacterium roseum]NCI49079.1 imidazole glycerol phosphate synthase subunit HisH [Sediminibacterium roseum]
MKDPGIVIIDYGVGNTYSVANAIQHLGYKNLRISDEEKVIREADALILPGVGAFEACMSNLQDRNIVEILNEEVLSKKKPILGICVGMQLLATASEEMGIHEGLNWIEGRVKKLELPSELAVPHVGWNDVMNNEEKLFGLNQQNANFYFDHSFYFDCEEKYVAAYCDYGIKVTAAVKKENIFGVQFHPEKSQTNGLKLFRSFFNSI